MKSQAYSILYTILFVAVGFIAFNSSAVVDAADDLVLLEKRHSGYWTWLYENATELDINQDGTNDVTIYPVSKAYLSDITSDDYRIFLRSTVQKNNRRVITFLDGTGIDIDRSTYGKLDAKHWTISNGTNIRNTADIEGGAEDIPLSEITDIYQYLSTLDNPGFSFVISVMDDASYSWNNTLDDLFDNIGLKERPSYRGSYIAIVESGKVKLEEKSDSLLEYSGTIDELSLQVRSAGWEKGNTSNIIIDGTEHSIHMRGLNIVVLQQGKVIDAVNFDTYRKLMSCFR